MSDSTSSADGAAKVAELVDQARTCMLTTMTDDGRHVSRPMVLQDVEFDGDLWFFALKDSAKVAQLRSNPQVNVAFADDKHQAWTSVSGSASVVQDRAKMEELWSAPLQVWFSDGLDTPGATLIRVHAESAEWWESSSSTVRRLIGAARAAVTGDPDKFPADNESTTLP